GVDVADGQFACRQVLLRLPAARSVHGGWIGVMQISHQLDAGVADVADGVDCLVQGVFLERVGGKSQAEHGIDCSGLLSAGGEADKTSSSRNANQWQWVERILIMRQVMRRAIVVCVVVMFGGVLASGCASKNGKKNSDGTP